MTQTINQNHQPTTLEEIRTRAIKCALVLFERSGDQSYMDWAQRQSQAALRARAATDGGADHG